MHYRYQVIRTDGANGTTIRHNSNNSNTNNNIEEEDSIIYTLGEINGYTYIYAESLENQPTELVFEEVTLTTELLNTLKEQNYIKQAKLNARAKIRNIKDFEDDLTDLKKVVQFMARGFAGLWQSLPTDIKDSNPYRDNFDIFSTAIMNASFRLDLEADQVAKISKILNDEEIFTEIVNLEYLSKL